MTPSYRTCVLGGCSIAIAVSTLFATRTELSPLLWLAIASLAVAVALLLAAMTKVLFGNESFTFLHYQIAAIAAVALVHAPALNLLALALAIAQAFGRLGCASAGCCYGRDDIPLQKIESSLLFVIAALLMWKIEHAFVFYLLAYAVTRFTLEFFRGDRRRHFAGLSEAQWICVVTAISVAAWQRGAAIFIAAALLIASIAQMLRGRSVAISHGVTDGVEHYTISGITARRARRIARDANAQLVPGNARGVYHFVFGAQS